MSIIKLRTKIQKEFDKEIMITDLFQSSTIRLQAALLMGNKSDLKTSEKELDRLVSKLKNSNLDNNSDVAVIGMAIKAPGSKDISEYWNNLKNGVESIEHFNYEELLASGVSESLLKNKNYVSAQSYLEGKENFDHSFFGYIPDEAKLMDPQIRVFHETVWSALEDAGYDPFIYKGLIGLYSGASPNLKWEVFSMISNEEKEPEKSKVRPAR